MKNAEEIEIPLMNIDRDPKLLAISVLLSALIVYTGYRFLVNMNGWGFILMIPGSILSFQSIWLLMNPFALVYADKIEIKQSLMRHKYRYFVDLKKISRDNKGKVIITYNDDEVEALNLFGVKTSQVDQFVSEISKSVQANMAVRP